MRPLRVIVNERKEEISWTAEQQILQFLRTLDQMPNAAERRATYRKGQRPMTAPLELLPMVF